VRAVVTRERGLNDELRASLPDDAIVDEVPLTTTRYFNVDDVERALRAKEHYGSFAALVVSSARSAAYAGVALPALEKNATVLCVGNATAHALSSEGIAVDVVGEGGALELAPFIATGPVLLLGAAAPREELRDELATRGIEAAVQPCYETVPAALSAADEQAVRDADVIFIGAPSAWTVAQGLVRIDAVVVVPGATTGEIVRRSHERVLEGWGAELRSRLAAL
jgi:uroporphyrinogen-III synthase